MSMNKDNFVYNNELTNLQNEFKNLGTTQLEQSEQITQQDKQNKQDSNSGLNVSVDNTNYVQELVNKLKTYVEENKPSLAILTPCYGGLCYSNYTISLINTLKIFESCNFPIKPYFLNNDSLVPRARNNLIASAMLDLSTTHFIFIDADIVWNPFDIIKLILANKLIIGGIYPKKSYKFNKISTDPSIINNWIEKKNKINLNICDEDLIKNNLLDYNINYLSTNLQIKKNIIELKHLATGFMLLQREVIETMIQNFPEKKYIDDTGFISSNDCIYTYALFDCEVIDGHYYSEDWLFSHRWSSLGGKIYADISIDLVHIGTENYNGSYIKNLFTTKNLND